MTAPCVRSRWAMLANGGLEPISNRTRRRRDEYNAGIEGAARDLNSRHLVVISPAGSCSSAKRLPPQAGRRLAGPLDTLKKSTPRPKKKAAVHAAGRSGLKGATTPSPWLVLLASAPLPAGVKCVSLLDPELDESRGGNGCPLDKLTPPPLAATTTPPSHNIIPAHLCRGFRLRCGGGPRPVDFPGWEQAVPG
jgi:hypothetical protein